MRRLVLAAGVLVAAPGAFATERVVVVEPSATMAFSWVSGARAVVAELMVSDVQLVLRPSQAATIAELSREVLDAAAEPATAGAVGVGREGSLGFALVARHAGRAPVRIEDDIRKGPVADGAVALRVSEVLRVRSFDLPPEPLRPEPLPRPPEPPLAPAWPWLGVAGVAARGASGVAPVLAFGLRVPLGRWVALEPSGAVTLGTLRVGTVAGDVELATRQALLELVFAPSTDRGLTAGAAAGGGLAWLTAVPRAGAGYIGRERSTQVSALALRGFGAWHAHHLRVMAFLEAGVFFPAATLRAGSMDVARVGQPWVMSGVALGYSP
jgi:hypothetical protein